MDFQLIFHAIYKVTLVEFVEVPDVGQVLVFCKDKLLDSCEVVRELIKRNDTTRATIPPLFLPMMRVQLLKMENVFMPGFSTITWTSTEIPEYCHKVTEVLDYIEMFVKEVRDMKEARIDEVLETIATTCLVYLPNEPIAPLELLKENVKYSQTIGWFQTLITHNRLTLKYFTVKELKLKSVTIERCVKDLINKFLSVITQPEMQDELYDWLDPVKAVKPIGSTSRLLTSADAGK